jgi:hypothetical protein
LNGSPLLGQLQFVVDQLFEFIHRLRAADEDTVDEKTAVSRNL